MEWLDVGQCEACDAPPPIHSEYGLCEECIRARGWTADGD